MLYFDVKSQQIGSDSVFHLVIPVTEIFIMIKSIVTMVHIFEKYLYAYRVFTS